MGGRLRGIVAGLRSRWTAGRSSRRTPPRFGAGPHSHGAVAARSARCVRPARRYRSWGCPRRGWGRRCPWGGGSGPVVRAGRDPGGVVADRLAVVVRVGLGERGGGHRGGLPSAGCRERRGGRPRRPGERPGAADIPHRPLVRPLDQHVVPPGLPRSRALSSRFVRDWDHPAIDRDPARDVLDGRRRPGSGRTTPKMPPSGGHLRDRPPKPHPATAHTARGRCLDPRPNCVK